MQIAIEAQLDITKPMTAQPARSGVGVQGMPGTCVAPPHLNTPTPMKAPDFEIQRLYFSCLSILCLQKQFKT